MALPATEDFNEGNGNTPANWTNVFNSLICDTSDFGRAGAAGDYNLALWASDVFSNDQYSKTVYKAAGFAGVAVRMSGSGGTRTAYYLLVTLAGASRLSKVVNGSITDLIAPGGISDPAVDDVIEIRVSGTSVSAYYNGVQQGATQTDSDIASGSAGVIFFDTNARIDDWEGGNIGAAGGTPFFTRLDAVRLR